MTRNFLIMFGTAMLLPAAALGQDDKEYQAIRSELKMLREKAVASVNKGDVEQLLTEVRDDVIFIAPALKDDLKFNHGHKAVKDYYGAMLSGPNPRAKSVTIAPKTMEAPIILGDTAIAWGTSQDTYKLSDGSDFIVPTQWSATLIKDNGAWKIAQCHISIDAFTNPILDAAIRQSTYLAAAVAGGVGLIVGAVAGGIIARRKRSP